ncbi:amidohydrolase family protein [Streptomyces sp. NPDC004752]
MSVGATEERGPGPDGVQGMAHRIGRIEPGMLADVIVVDQNPFEVPITQVHATKVKMTFVEGEPVYDLQARKSGQGSL